MARRGAGSELGWEPAPSRAGSPPTSPPSSPAWGSPGSRSTARPGRSPEPVRRRLRDLSDRFYGAHAIHLRERPIPWAYRVFFRQIGLDPDRTRTPVEQLALDRLHDGAFKSRGLPADALTIAIVETGVALRAFDADRLEGALCIRDSAPGRVAAGPAGRAGAGDAGDRRRARPGRAALRRPPARAAASSADSRRHRDRRDPGRGRAADRGRRGALDGRGDARRRLSGLNRFIVCSAAP